MSTMHMDRKRNPDEYMNYPDPMQARQARGLVQLFSFCPVVAPRAP